MNPERISYLNTSGFLLLLAAVAFVVGCSKKGSDLSEKRLASVEARVESQNQILAGLNNELNQLRSNLDFQSNCLVYVATNSISRGEMDVTEREIDKLIGKIYSQQPEQAQTQPRPGPPISRASTGPDVPNDVYNSIVAAAQRQWPGNYEMQVFTITNQVEAWRTLRDFQNARQH